MKKVFIIGDVFELMISIILSERDDIFIIYTYNFVENQDILKRTEKIRDCIFIDFNSDPYTKLLLYWYRKKFFLEHFFKKFKFFNINKIERIMSFSDQIVIAQYFISKNIPLDLYEHGIINYKESFNGLSIKIKKIFLNIDQPYGRSKNVENVYLLKPEKAPQIIRDKVKPLNLKKLSKEENKKEILEIFNLDENKIEIYKNKKYILLTQPLSEDGYMSEKDKIKIYKNILDKYNKNKIIIKPHPREKTEYFKVFGNIKIIKSVFPIELLDILDIKFERAITLFSSSALNINTDKVDFYGSEIDERLFKEFGSMDKIFKRNAFLSDRDENN